MIWDDLRCNAMICDYSRWIAIICDDCCKRFKLKIRKTTQNKLINATQEIAALTTSTAPLRDLSLSAYMIHYVAVWNSLPPKKSTWLPRTRRIGDSYTIQQNSSFNRET